MATDCLGRRFEARRTRSIDVASRIDWISTIGGPHRLVVALRAAAVTEFGAGIARAVTPVARAVRRANGSREPQTRA
jgi:hypothetical protein